MISHHPYLLFCPYLPLKQPASFARWIVAPIQQHTGPWRDSDFEKQARAFLAKFQDANGRPIESPAVIGDSKAGVDGVLPGESELAALQLALQFATLDRNPAWAPDADGSFTLTTDNADLWAQPIDVAQGYVAIERGLVVRALGGGWRIADERFVIRSPLELHMPITPLSLEADVLGAIHDVALREDAVSKRIATAVHWLAKAWQNSRSIGWDDRIVMLRTAFEALTGSSDIGVALQTLEGLFAELRNRGETDQSTDHLLWAPSEAARRTFTWTTRGGKTKSQPLTDLGHWFSTFGQARHVVIHEGQVPNLVYQETGSRYNGPLFHTGERVLRESIKVALIQVGYQDLWQDALTRSLSKYFSSQESAEEKT